MKTYNNNTVTSTHEARARKHDEFYTQLKDIDDELSHYVDHFKGKSVFCKCDDPATSEFFRYFVRNFKFLQMKELFSTHYKKKGASYSLSYDGQSESPERFLNWIRTDGGMVSRYHRHLKENGDFRSEECVEMLKKSDIVVTNPPFSLFREYFDQLMEYKKKFLIIANINAVGYRDIWPRIRDGEVWLGAQKKRGATFMLSPNEKIRSSSGYEKDGTKYAWVSTAIWLTNLSHDRRKNDRIELTKRWSRDKGIYQKYDNYNAIDVPLVAGIPEGYEGKMGVPITFLTKHNPDQFNIHGLGMNSDPSFVPTKLYKESVRIDKGGGGI